MPEQNAYQRHGYRNRREYLNSLADERGLSREHVYLAADALGPSEDFDGLVTTLEDMEEGLYDEYL